MQANLEIQTNVNYVNYHDEIYILFYSEYFAKFLK